MDNLIALSEKKTGPVIYSSSKWPFSHAAAHSSPKCQLKSTVLVSRWIVWNILGNSLLVYSICFFISASCSITFSTFRVTYSFLHFASTSTIFFVHPDFTFFKRPSVSERSTWVCDEVTTLVNQVQLDWIETTGWLSFPTDHWSVTLNSQTVCESVQQQICPWTNICYFPQKHKLYPTSKTRSSLSATLPRYWAVICYPGATQISHMNCNPVPRVWYFWPVPSWFLETRSNHIWTRGRSCGGERGGSERELKESARPHIF